MNLVVNQTIIWTEPVFSGSYPKSEYLGERTTKAVIVKDSYGSRRGQHSFSLRVIYSTGVQPLVAGETYRRLGRNLYKTASVIEQPDNLEELLADKEKRAKEAKERKFYTWLNEAESEGKEWKLEKIPFWFIQQNKEDIQRYFPICCSKLSIH